MSEATAAALQELCDATGVAPQLARDMLRAGASLRALKLPSTTAPALIHAMNADRVTAGRTLLTVIESGMVASVVEEFFRHAILNGSLSHMAYTGRECMMTPAPMYWRAPTVHTRSRAVKGEPNLNFGDQSQALNVPRPVQSSMRSS